MILTTKEAEAIDAQIGRLESRTGVQVVTAVVGKSDTYVELPWKAFALGAAFAGFAVVVADMRWPQWITSHTALIHATIDSRRGGRERARGQSSFRRSRGSSCARRGAISRSVNTRSPCF